jgi:hypothetical protein
MDRSQPTQQFLQQLDQVASSAWLQLNEHAQRAVIEACGRVPWLKNPYFLEGLAIGAGAALAIGLVIWLMVPRRESGREPASYRGEPRL